MKIVDMLKKAVIFYTNKGPKLIEIYSIFHRKIDVKGDRWFPWR